MREIHEGTLLRYRCRASRAFLVEPLQAAPSEEWERAPYRGLRIPEQRPALVRHLADGARDSSSRGSVQELEQRTLSYQEGAEIVRRLIPSGRRDRGSGPGDG